MSKDYKKAAISLIAKSTKVMIGSIGEDGFPYVKVMYKPREINGLKTFYFSTNTSTLRVSQFKKNPRASIFYHDGRFFKGLLLKGKMEILEDQSIKERIWKKGDELYYPLGVSDPDYCILKFEATTGRFYENSSSTEFDIE